MVYCTLHNNHPDFGKAIAMLQAAIYQIDKLDEAAVMQALLNGTFNHAGLARHNTKIRWQLWMDLLSSAERDAIPFYFWCIVCHYDHLRLQLVNQMARSAGVEHDVHKGVRPLPEDNGKRFYGDYYLELAERKKIVPGVPDDDQCQCGACSGSPTPLPFEMVAATSAAMKTGLPQSNDTSVLQSAATRMSTMPATATNGALLPTTTGSRPWNSPTLTFPRMVVPGLFVQAPQQYPVCFLVHPIYYAPYQLLPQPLPFLLVQQAARPVIVSSSRPRRRKQQVEYHCCKKYWKHHVVNKQEGKMGGPPHCLDCPV
jgi:hypothetical protein